jgi:calcineurin-like phosphoesterase family protein
MQQEYQHQPTVATPRMTEAFARVTGPQRVRSPARNGPGVVLNHLPGHAAGTDEPGSLGVMGNLHGHIHQRTSPTPQHCNVCVEHTGYQPITLDEAISRLARSEEDGRGP